MLGNQISLTNNVAKQVVSVTATQNQTDFTVQGGYRINQLGVYRNGVRQVDGRDYIARNGATVTLLSQGANAGDAMEFVVFDDFRVADALSVNTGGTVNASVNITGALQMGTGTSIFSPAENELTLGTNSAERVRIKSNGLVGIGTNNPNRKLVIAGDAGTGAIQLKRTNAAVDGSSYGTIWFRNADDVDIALIRSRRESAIDDSNICFETTESGQSRSEKLRIKSNGFVGIGTDNPTRVVHVQDDSNTLLALDSTDTNADIVQSDTVGSTRIRSNSGHLDFFTGGDASSTNATNSERRVRITSGGSVGIATTSPLAKLQVAGSSMFGPEGAGQYQGIQLLHGRDSSANLATGFIDFRNNLNIPDAHLFVDHGTDGSSAIIFGTTPTGARNSDRRQERLRINSSGDVGIGTDSPPARLSGIIQSNVTKYLPSD